MPIHSRLLILALSVALGALVVPAPAIADSVVAELARPVPLAAYGGVVAWSRYDARSGRYQLVIRRAGKNAPAPVADSVKPFDVSLGPDARGRVVALYTRCQQRERNCDIYRYDVRARRERMLASVSSAGHDEAWPVQWHDRIAFVRRARSWVRNVYDPRPDPAGRRRGSTLLDCDVPYVRSLSARASRRLDRGACGRTDGMSMRGDRIVQVTSFYLDFNAAQSQVRVLRAHGGAARVIANTTGGLDGVSSFQSPSQSATAVWLTRVGNREPMNLLRIDLAPSARRPGRLRPPMAEVSPGGPLAGRVVRDDRGTLWYLQAAEPSFVEDETTELCMALQPCRLIRAAADPFSSKARTLAPRLRLSLQGYDGISGLFTDGITLSGTLTRDVVRGTKTVGLKPLPAIAVELFGARRFDGTYAATGATTHTDASGRWSLTLAAPPSGGYFVAAARAARLASQVVGAAVEARVTLTATGSTLTGTVTPAQPGRTIEIQRLDDAVAATPLPGGSPRCQPPDAAGQRQCDSSVWKAVAKAPLAGDGRSFAATVAAPGTYRAELPSEEPAFSPKTGPGIYYGLSPQVRVAG